MNTDLIQKIKSMQWERWLERPFHAFVMSLFEDSSRKESFEKIHIPGVELRAQLYQNGSWYINHEVFDEMDKQVEVYLKNHSMADVTESLAKFKEEHEKEIKELINADIQIEEKYKKVFEILKLDCTYIWLAHGLETYYERILKAEVPKYVKKDVDTFIGDASFPIKKNAHSRMEDALRAGKDTQEIAKKYGWIKVRDGFAEPFKSEELEKMRLELAPVNIHKGIEIPKELQNLFSQVQELVFFRTERTDVFYYLFYLARPILQETAKKFGIAFNEMQYYRAKSFIDGTPEKYVPKCTFAYLDGEVLFQDEPITEDVKARRGEEVKGMIAYKGKVQGTVKIVKNVSELDKVKNGDILVTQMTFPSFIPAMVRAAAFVTDEGGITCHAAIVARELHKPCIIGTKKATQVLRDGDMVEVDADKGIVKILT